MFLENTVNHKEQFGWIEVICGSMFSGKTEELIRRLKRAQFAQQKIEIFKPAIDLRYDDQLVTSHDQNQIPSTPVPAAANIPMLADSCDVVGIDEAQFFDDEIVKVCNDLANRGIRVIVAGLDMDYRGNPFGPMPALMATAEYVTSTTDSFTKQMGVNNYNNFTDFSIGGTASNQYSIGENNAIGFIAALNYRYDNTYYEDAFNGTVLKEPNIGLAQNTIQQGRVGQIL